MRALIFAENTLTKFELEKATIYSDNAFDNSSVMASDRRKSGFIPGKEISPITMNTALRQSSVVTYLLTQVLNKLSEKLALYNPESGLHFDNISMNDAGLSESTTALINYLKILNKLCPIDVTGQDNTDNSNMYKVNKAQIANDYAEGSTLDNLFSNIKNGNTLVNTILNCSHEPVIDNFGREKRFNSMSQLMSYMTDTLSKTVNSIRSLN